jgi:hypothetical protein
MANGQEKAKENLDAFLLWKVAQTDETFRGMVYRGKLHRRDISTACGFGVSALGQNPAIKDELEKLENALREREILPSKSEELIEKEQQPKEFDQSTNGNAQNKRRLSKLEQENIELHAKVRELDLKLAKFKELGDVISELGMMPR